MLIGRDRQAAELARLLADDRAVVVVGEAGVGKTALLRSAAEASGRPTAEGGALSTLSWMDYLPLRRALGRPVRHGDAIAVSVEVESAIGAGVLILDDLHWADAATLEVTVQLAGRIGLLAGVRRGDPAAEAVLDRLRDAGFVEVWIAPLAIEDSVDLLRRLRPDLISGTVEKVVARSGGNPLLLRELSATGEPTASLRLSIAARLRNLDAVGRDTFALLALAGRPLPVDILGEAGVKSLLDADLVVPAADTGVQVRHALLAEVLVDQLDPDEARALHARLARAFLDDGQAARHYHLAGETDLAFAAALRAAEATQRPGEQASHLAIAAACASGPQADELRLRAARALERANNWDAMVAVLDLVDPDNRPAQAETCLLRARSAWSAGDNQGLRSALEAGMALVDDPNSEIAVQLRIEHGRVPIFLDADLERGVTETAAALDLARSAGVDVPRAEYLYGTALAIADEPGGAEHLEKAIEAAHAAGDVSTEFLAANNLASFHESSDDQQAARELCRRFIARAHDLGLGDWEQGFQAALLGLDFHAADYDSVLLGAEELLDRIREKRARDTVMESLCLSLIDLGRIDEALRRLDTPENRFIDDYRGKIQHDWILTEASLWGGRPAEALKYAERAATMSEEDPNLVFFHCSRGWARFDLGEDPGPAPPPHPRAMLSAVSPEVAGIGLLHRGEDAAAAESFRTAAARWAPFHQRGELRCLWAQGEATRRTGDRDAAIELLSDAEARLTRLGMLPLLSRVHRSLRAAGVRRSAPRTRSAGDLLTGRQRELLRLVGDGLTNAEIAQRLGISRHTVVSQLASSVAKLGATSRTHAATLAASGTA
ncbi:MAG TPA: LuxR C-terminal-related transcriptional regulator [Jatrophihabitantaceae bacterium]